MRTKASGFVADRHAVTFEEVILRDQVQSFVSAFGIPYLADFELLNIGIQLPGDGAAQCAPKSRVSSQEIRTIEERRLHAGKRFTRSEPIIRRIGIAPGEAGTAPASMHQRSKGSPGNP